MNSQKTKVAVLGFGREGQAASQWFDRQGAEIIIVDENLKILPELPGVKISQTILGKGALEKIPAGIDLIVRSPGVNYHRSELKPFYRRNIVTSLTNLIVENSRARIIGITGTKGKGTTASIVYRILENNTTNRVLLGGNIGQTILDQAAELTRDDWLILELSSFQLGDFRGEVDIAIILGIFPDHFDYHADMTDYLKAKRNLIIRQKSGDKVIVNFDDESAEKIGEGSNAEVFGFGIDSPIEKGAILHSGSIAWKEKGEIVDIMPIEQVPLLGRHNLLNALAAVAAAKVVGINPKQISQSIRSFKPLQYRLEVVGSLRGHKIINDSLSTTPTSTARAVEAMTRSFTIICGGKDKGLDFMPLVEALNQARGLDRIILYGENQSKIKDSFEAAGITDFESVDDLVSAIKAAIAQSKPNSQILFSPAAASFDQFRDAYERGEKFNQIIESLSGGVTEDA